MWKGDRSSSRLDIYPFKSIAIMSALNPLSAQSKSNQQNGRPWINWTTYTTWTTTKNLHTASIHCRAWAKLDNNKQGAYNLYIADFCSSNFSETRG